MSRTSYVPSKVNIEILTGVRRCSVDTSSHARSGGLSGDGVAESFKQPLKTGDAFTESRDLLMHLLAKRIEFRPKAAYF